MMIVVDDMVWFRMYPMVGVVASLSLSLSVFVSHIHFAEIIVEKRANTRTNKQRVNRIDDDAIGGGGHFCVFKTSDNYR